MQQVRKSDTNVLSAAKETINDARYREIEQYTKKIRDKKYATSEKKEEKMHEGNMKY